MINTFTNDTHIKQNLTIDALTTSRQLKIIETATDTTPNVTHILKPDMPVDSDVNVVIGANDNDNSMSIGYHLNDPADTSYGTLGVNGTSDIITFTKDSVNINKPLTVNPSITTQDITAQEAIIRYINTDELKTNIISGSDNPTSITSKADITIYKNGDSNDDMTMLKLASPYTSEKARLQLTSGFNKDIGQLELSTCNGGNEPIYVRQYTGDFNTISQSATILDSNGNTSFPNTVTSKQVVISDQTAGNKPGLHLIGNGDGGGIFANPHATANENIEIASSIDISSSNEGNEPITVSQYKGTVDASNPTAMYNTLVNRITLMNTSGNQEFNGATFTSSNYGVEVVNTSEEGNGDDRHILRVLKPNMIDGAKVEVLVGKEDTTDKSIKFGYCYKEPINEAYGTINIYGHDDLMKLYSTKAQFTIPVEVTTLTASTSVTTPNINPTTTNGTINVAGNLNVQTSGDTNPTSIVLRNSSNDHGRLLYSSSSVDAGYLELATDDNGNEPIYVRQYTGNGFIKLTRTATLLDGSGNTVFPGSLTAAGVNITNEINNLKALL